MDAEYWHRKWRDNDIAFHERAANPALVTHVGALALAPGNRIFLPLCGKTLDIGWLLSRGCRVAGAELSALAVGQLFEELGVQPEVRESGPLAHHRADGIDVFVGDIFDLAGAALGPVDAVYDRAALVALDAPLRRRYAGHLASITGHAPQLLISYEYDQDRMPGPPFSVSRDEVRALYRGGYDVRLAASSDVPGGLKGRCPATEHVWVLRPLRRTAPA